MTSINDILTLLIQFQTSSHEIHVGHSFCRTSYKLQHFGHGLFQFVAKFHMFFLLYASTTLSMLPEDWLDARGNHLVSFD